MNYRHIYMLIIEHAKSEEKLGLRKKGNGEYYEKHHILPKSLYPQWAKEKRNIVLLTAREHFFCHELLTKIFPSPQMTYALWAFISRPNSDYRITMRQYEKIKRERSELVSKQMKGNTYGFKKGQIMPITLRKLRGEKIIPWNKGLYGYKIKSASEERKQKISKANKGKKHFVSEETRKKLSESHKGHIVEEETKQKISKANKGKPTWCKGIKMTEKQKENMKINARKRARNCGYKILLVNTNETFDCLQDIIDKYPQFLKSHILSCINGFRKYHGILNNQKCVWKKLI